MREKNIFLESSTFRSFGLQVPLGVHEVVDLNLKANRPVKARALNDNVTRKTKIFSISIACSS